MMITRVTNRALYSSTLTVAWGCLVVWREIIAFYIASYVYVYLHVYTLRKLQKQQYSFNFKKRTRPNFSI